MPCRQTAFSLIELLVVIAIIAVLAGILFPVFSRVRENARKTDCLSHLQQLTTAMRAYSTDYGGYIVNWCVTHPNPLMAPSGGGMDENSPHPLICTWDVSIQPYLRGNQAVLTCRSNHTVTTPHGPRARAYAMAQYTQTMLGANCWGAFEGDIPNPTETVLLFEKGDNLPGAWGDALGQNVYESHRGPLLQPYQEVPGETIGGVNVRMFHFKGKNFAFVDGHAKYYSVGQGPFGRMGVSVPIPGHVQYYTDLPPGS